MRVDGQGDAYIKFFKSDYDDEDFLKQWVWRETFWSKLELPGKTVRTRASKTVSCLNNCTTAQNCEIQMMSKKKAKVFRKCMNACKLEECTKEEECNKLMNKYNQC